MTCQMMEFFQIGNKIATKNWKKKQCRYNIIIKQDVE